MARYRYMAVDADGGLVEGELEAAGTAAAMAQVQALGHAPINVEAVGRWRPGRLELKRRPRLPVARLVRDLGTLLAAGVPLDRSLTMLTETAAASGEAQLLGTIRDTVRGGSTLSAAMEQSGSFSRFHLNMVRAGEASGALGEVLLRLAESVEQVDTLRENIKSALIYPLLLLVITLGSLIVLITFVVPKFTVLFEEMGRELPLATRIVIDVGDALRGYWWLFLLLGLLAALGLRAMWRNPEGRQRLDGWLLRAPVAGAVVVRVEMAVFSRTFATLLTNGVPLLSALAIVRDTLSNRVLRESVARLQGAVKEGGSLGAHMAADGHFPPLAVNLVRVGEETGKLEPMLAQIATIYDREVRLAVQRALALLEPALIVGMGLAVGGIIVSILMAILSINDLTL